MKITPHDVVTYQTIYKYRTGKSMKSEKAYKQLQKLVTQMQLIYQEIDISDIKDLSIEIDENERYVEPPEQI